jgi:hypothetical protein
VFVPACAGFYSGGNPESSILDTRMQNSKINMEAPQYFRYLCTTPLFGLPGTYPPSAEDMVGCLIPDRVETWRVWLVWRMLSMLGRYDIIADFMQFCSSLLVFMGTK